MTSAPQPILQSPPPKVFISYSRRDRRWLDEFKTQLAPFLREAQIDAWDNTIIDPGENWKQVVENALAAADVGVLLVTPSYLASSFIVENELPPLLEGKRIFWIAVSASGVEVTPIARFQAANDPSRPLNTLAPPQRAQEWVRICKKLAEAVKKRAAQETVGKPDVLALSGSRLQRRSVSGSAGKPIAQGAQMYISIEEIGREITLTFRRNQRSLLSVSFSRSKLDRQQQKLRDDLEKIQRCIGRDLSVVDWENVLTALDILHERGRIMAEEFFGEDCARIAYLFRRYCHGGEPETSAGPYVEVEATMDSILPIEFLPLLKMESPQRDKINNLADLKREFRAFLGYSLVIRRIFRRYSLPESKNFDSDRKLPIKIFHNASLTGARKELEFFQEHPRVDIDGPWPDRQLTDEELRQVPTLLRDPMIRFNGERRDLPDQIFHFACHCDTISEDDEEHFVELACDNWPLKLYLKQLRSQFPHLQALENKKYQGRNGLFRPLVFLNARGTAANVPSGVASFADFFIRHHYLGFMGTAASIPDEVAAEFSKQFYNRLLDGQPLGPAFYEAKWILLERYNNPLGLLYVMFADPDIKLHRSIDAIAA